MGLVLLIFTGELEKVPLRYYNRVKPSNLLYYLTGFSYKSRYATISTKKSSYGNQTTMAFSMEINESMFINIECV